MEVSRQSRRYSIIIKEAIIVNVSEHQPKYFPKSKVGDMMMIIQNTKKRKEEEEEEEEEMENVATKTI